MALVLQPQKEVPVWDPERKPVSTRSKMAVSINKPNMISKYDIYNGEK